MYTGKLQKFLGYFVEQGIIYLALLFEVYITHLSVPGYEAPAWPPRKFLALVFYFIVFNFFSHLHHLHRIDSDAHCTRINFGRLWEGTECEIEATVSFKAANTVHRTRHLKIRNAITKWSKHGQLLLAAKENTMYNSHYHVYGCAEKSWSS